MLTLLFSVVPHGPAASEVDLSVYARSDYNRLEYVDTLNPAPGFYSVRYRNDVEYYLNHFVVTNKGVVVFDPTSDTAAAAMLDEIRQRAEGKPLLAIIYSHLHTDHIAGARVLLDNLNPDAMVIAHERTGNFIERRKLTAIVPPTHTVGDEGATFNFGDLDVELRFLGTGHTNSVLVPVIPQLKLAYAVDFANGDVVGWTTMPGWNIGELQRMKSALLELDVQTVVFGHGLPGDKDTVRRQIDYYDDLQASVQAAIDDGLSVDETVRRIDLPEYSHFWNYSDWFKANVRGMYRYLNRP